MLLVVDMQPGFAAANDYGLIQNVRREVCRAKQEKRLVVLLEYEKHGATFSQITAPISSYQKVLRVRKISEDGGIDVLDKCFFSGYNVGDISVCGVNTELCVLKTVESLHQFSPKSNITILSSACGSLYENDFKVFKHLKRVQVR